MENKIKGVTRLEVIDENGRSYVNWDKNNIISLSFQDEGKTLKIFISQKCGKCRTHPDNMGNPFCTDNFCNK